MKKKKNLGARECFGWLWGRNDPFAHKNKEKTDKGVAVSLLYKNSIPKKAAFGKCRSRIGPCMVRYGADPAAVWPRGDGAGRLGMRF